MSARHARVLLIDDNRDAVDSLALLLEIEGCTVRRSYGADQALPAALEFTPTAILIEPLIREATHDGFAVARLCRRHPALRGVAIAALTTLGRPADQQRLKTGGFDRVFRKPAEPDEILAFVSAAGVDRSAADAQRRSSAA